MAPGSLVGWRATDITQLTWANCVLVGTIPTLSVSISTLLQTQLVADRPWSRRRTTALAPAGIFGTHRLCIVALRVSMDRDPKLT